MTELVDVGNLWFDETESGANYSAQYMPRKKQQVTARNNARTNKTYVALENAAICIATTRFPCGKGNVPNAGQPYSGVAGPVGVPPDVQLFLNHYFACFPAFMRRPRYINLI